MPLAIRKTRTRSFKTIRTPALKMISYLLHYRHTPCSKPNRLTITGRVELLLGHSIFFYTPLLSTKFSEKVDGKVTIFNIGRKFLKVTRTLWRFSEGQYWEDLKFINSQKVTLHLFQRDRHFDLFLRGLAVKWPHNLGWILNGMAHCQLQTQGRRWRHPCHIALNFYLKY